MKKLILLLALISMPTFAFAATQGQKGETSQGSAVITLKIPEMIIATGLADLTVDVNDKTANTVNNFPIGATDYVASDGICVASNNSRSGGNKYSLLATNSNNTGGSDFFVIDQGMDDTNKVYFKLTYNDNKSTSEDLKQNTSSGSSFVAHTALTACDTGAVNNATYTVTFTATGGTSDRPSIDMGPAGIYTSTVTFLFTPNNESDDY